MEKTFNTLPQVKLIVATTADGYIAREQNQNSTTWTSAADKKFFAQKSKEIGLMIMGRPTYDTIGFPLPGRISLVLTRDQNKITPPEQWHFFDQDHKLKTQIIYTALSGRELLVALANQGIEQLAICGGARVYQEWLSSGLVDEIFQTIEKEVSFGAGISFLPAGEKLSDKYYLQEEIVLSPATIVKHWLKK